MKKYVAIIFFSLLIIMVVINIFNQKEIKENKLKTLGRIIELNHSSLVRYTLIYEYNVNGKKYLGDTNVSYFKCEDGTEGCVGKEFYVYYSSKNPEYSRIYLGKYEKYKTTLELFK